MKRLEDEAYVLETRELGDADLIVTLFAGGQGRVRAVARSARSSRRRFGGALEPLTRAVATWFEREGRELHRLESLDCSRSFARMQAEPVCQAACAVIAEITRTFTHEGQADPDAFRLIGAVLEALDEGGDPWVVLRYFEYWMLRLHGLLPDLSCCSACGRTLGGEPQAYAAQLGLRCAACAGPGGSPGERLTSGERRLLELAPQTAPSRLPGRAGLGPPGTALERLLRGTLEAHAERSFRAYRHLHAAQTARTGDSPS